MILSAGVYSHAARPDWAGHGPPPEGAVGLSNFPFDAASGPPPAPPGLSRMPKKPGAPKYVIIKFTDRQNQAARDRLSAQGVRFYGYVPVNAFLAKLPPETAGNVESDPSVANVYDFLPAYRLGEAPLGRALRGEKGQNRMVVQIFDDEPVAPVAEAVTGLGGESDVLSDRPGLNGKFLKVQIDASRTAELASIDGVMWVEDELIPEFMNDKAAVVTRVSDAWSLPLPLAGTGQVVAVCDSGLDTGDTATLHADFSGTTTDGKAKLKSTYTYGRPGDWSDPYGHGTHTSGSVIGTGVKSSELAPGTLIRGMAYDAQLVMQSILNSSGGLSVPNINTTVFPDAYSRGARVHSNSWGYNGLFGVYEYNAVQADTYTWNHKDFTVIFSAGNSGVDSNPADGVVDTVSVTPPSTAKNVISVGASENDRPGITTLYGTAIPNKYQPPVSNDRMADVTDGMAAFSSRGPCVDGRIKPDLVAPGTYVVSTRSTLAPPEHYWRTASATGYSASLDPYYAANGGTSMAAPLVAGAAAVVRQSLAVNGEPNPTSALVKALLITGAHDMTPGQYNQPDNDVTARPDANQGWGRLDAKGALFPDAPLRISYYDDKQGLATGFSNNYNYTILDASAPLRVSLVWTDYPGTSGTTPNIVNDLDLIVTTPDGTVYHGNRYSGSVSVPDDTGFDRLNNVEGVTVPASSLTTGTLTVSVAAYNAPQGPQPYALVVSAGLSDPPVVSSITPSSAVNNFPVQVSVTGSGFVDGCSLRVGGVACQTGSVTSTAINATVPAGITPGTYGVNVQNPDGMTGVLQDGFTVIEDTAPPAATQGLAASAGDAVINLRWDVGAEPDLSGYRVYFNTYSTTLGAVGTHTLTGLTNGVSYSITLKATDLSGNMSAASTAVSATPFAQETELPHYDWDASSVWQCGSCHVAGTGTFMQGFDYRYDGALCLSCHNTASVGHRSPIKAGRSHAVMSNVTAGTSVMPTSGSVASGEYSDTMYTHLKGGDTVVCITCHNPMRKPHDTGRLWELLSTQDEVLYSSYRGGWWDQGHTKVKAYRYGSAGTLQSSRGRDDYRLSDGDFTYDEYAGALTLSIQTSLYAYLTLSDPYLRAPGRDNTACLDCHTQAATHRTYNCLACHDVHGESGLGFVRRGVRRPDGAVAPVVLEHHTGVNSFADGDNTYDGICEVCHTRTSYYRYDGSVLNNHTSTGLDYSGADCTACHSHAAGFLP